MKKNHIAEKSITLIFTILFTVIVNITYSQNTWTQKADFTVGARWGVTCFSIGSKGYLGTGYNGTTYKNDFWEYDPILNTWTQKANFGGVARYHATGFSIGSKGYLGTGIYDGSFKKDFWEYDPGTNSWIQKADFGGTARWAATGFSVDSMGYIGTGRDGPENNRNDFWEYDPGVNTWTQKANYGGGNRYLVTSFNIGSKGYAGTGWSGSTYQNDFWEYDPKTDIWTQKSNFGGIAREAAVGFNINDKGYIGTGYTGGALKKDFWEYDPGSDTWTQKADFGGNIRYVASGLAINGKGYIGMGYDGSSAYKDFWEYTPDSTVPSCPAPTTLTSFNITSIAAQLKWNAVSGAIGYKVRYKLTVAPEWTFTNAIVNHKTLSDLTASSEYVYQVKTLCQVQPIVSSEWSKKQFFTTDDLWSSVETIHETMFVREDSFVELYPNPVCQSATISFFINEASPIVIEIMNLNGRPLRVIEEKDFSAGNHEVTFNRESLSAGVYFLQLKTDEGMMMQKVVIQ